MEEAADRVPTSLQRVVREKLPPSPVDLPLPVLKDRADRLLHVLEATQAWISEFDGEGRMVYASPNVEVILGFTPEECLASDRMEFHPDDLPQVIEIGRTVRSTGEPGTNQTRIRHKKGHWVWLETSLLGCYSDDGAFHTISLSRDIGPLKHAEAARSESETRYRVVSEMGCDLIIEVDVEGRTTYVGPGAEEMVGYTAEYLVAAEPWSLVHPDDVARIREQLAREFQLQPRTDRPPGSDARSSSHGMMEYRAQHKDGRWLWFETLGLTYRRADGELSYLAVVSDVTQRKLDEQARLEFEEGLQRAQKLESLGVLAGGIAHDFNNLLTPILGAAALGLRELPADSPMRARLEMIQQAAERAAALTNQMLVYAGQQELRIEHLDLSKLVSEIQELVAASISGKTRIDLQLEPDLPAVEGEAAQISQLVMNLVTNASESLRDGVGRITIRTGVMDVSTPPPGALFAETMTTGRHVFFEVTDDGCGMDADTRARIFDPFYTTKFTGRGLGLAAVAGIVRAHRGAIEIDSDPDRGTRFRVLLPAAASGAVELDDPRAGADEWHTSAIALVIDDDEAVREIAAEVLSRVGMEVLTAADGLAGVELFDANADRIDVVLLDRTLPTMSGADTFEAIRTLRPEARILLASGYSEERAASELLSRGLAGFLKKPFSPAELLERVREVLEAPSPGPR